jgi:GT2 family glycosyltransferase
MSNKSAMIRSSIENINDPMVRVIVLNWNGRSWLGGCLTALRRQDFRPFEIVLVDNGSTDGSVDFVREHFSECRVIALSENVGFSAGNNAGARDATVPYLAFLNNDTQADQGWLTALVDAAEREATVGLVTSHIVFMDRPDIVDSAGDGYLRCGGGFKHRHGQPVDGDHGSREVFGACGAAFLIRRELFQALGGFDEDLFMVYEDVDLSYRARLLGARCVYEHGARVRHAGSASLGRMSTIAVYHGQRNLEWTWIKNSPRSLLLRSMPAHVLYDLAGLVTYAGAGRLGPWWHAKIAAVRGLPALWRKRREVQRTAIADPEALWTIMDRDWIGIKRREKSFDLHVR